MNNINEELLLNLLKEDTTKSNDASMNHARSKATWLSEQIALVVDADSIEQLVPMAGRKKGLRLDVIRGDELITVKYPQRSVGKNYFNLENSVFSEVLRVAMANPEKQVVMFNIVNRITPIYNKDGDIRNYEDSARYFLNSPITEMIQQFAPNVSEVLVIGNNSKEDLVPQSLEIIRR